jgi:hypothetical protein
LFDLALVARSIGKSQKRPTPDPIYSRDPAELPRSSALSFEGCRN